MTIQSTPMRLFSTSVLVAALSGFAFPALALDADDFATKVAALISQSGTKLSFAAIEPDGDTIMLKSTRIETPGQPAINVGDITFNGVEERDGGSYFVEQARFDDINSTNGATTISVVDLEVSELMIPAEPTYDTIDKILFYKGFSTGEINVTFGDDKIFSMAGLSMNVALSDDQSTVGMTMDGPDIWVDISRIDDPKAKKALSDLGYKTLTGDLKLDGIWTVGTGTFNLREYSLNLDNVGRLAMTMEISGYTLEFIKAMQQAQAAAVSNPDPEAAQQAMGFAMLGMLQQLSFHSASIRFDDGSVTEKALAYAGKQQGISGEQMRQSVKFMLPFMLGQLGIPALQKQISAAASAYLDNPQNLTISAKPADPVAVPVIMGAGMGNPKSLVELLNVQVTANGPVEVCCED